MTDFALSELFTAAQLQRAKDICATEHGNVELHARLMAVVDEALPNINAVTGHDNSVSYFAYVLEHTFSRSLRDG